MSSGDPETRQRILEVTRQLMESRRGQHVRLEDVAKAAGVSRQAVYLHFGNRTELLIQTARYLDEVLDLPGRLKPVLLDQGGVRNLETFIEFWADYIPEVYGLAKALLVAHDADEAAAAAWNDRMADVYGGCQRVVQCLEQEGILAAGWTVQTAADFMWGIFSVESWENLTIGRGWTNDQFREYMKVALKHALVKAT